MHRAGGRFSAWTFVQALRTNSPRPASRANPGHRRLALHMSVTTRQRQGAHVAELPCPARGDRRELVCTPQDRALPNLLLTVRGPVGTQPERDVLRLHRFPYHTPVSS
jgi:hypothetical protein